MRSCFRLWDRLVQPGRLRVRVDQLDPSVQDLLVREGLGQLALQVRQAQQVAMEQRALKAYREYLDQLDQLDRLGLQATQASKALPAR